MKDYSISILADIYGGLLTKRQFDLIRDYYDNDMSLAELSEKYNIARQTAKDGIDAAEKSLKSLEKKLKLSGRFKNIETAADEIAEIENGKYKALAEKIKLNL